MRFYRYSRWDGTQEVEPFTDEDLMQHLADEVLKDRDLLSAMREMMQRGANFQSGRRMSGMRDLLDRLKERRQDQLQRYNMGSVMDDIREQLEQILQAEREGIQRRLDEAGGEPSTDQPGDPPSADPSLQKLLQDMAQRHLQQLDALPPDVGGRMQQLRDYDFMDPRARQQFEELLNTLKQQVLQQYFQGMKQALGAVTPEQMGQLRNMLADLNDLMQKHRQGDDSGFQDFMEKWKDYFPEGMENVDQLAQHLNQRMAAMRSLMDSMTPEMRRELEQMVDSLWGNDEGLAEELSELMSNLQRMFPSGRDEGMPFSGDEPVSLQEAMRLMGDMRELDELERDLIEAARTNDSSRLDPDELGRLVGDEARQIAQELQDFVKMLEEAGFIQRKGREWVLTPRAMRKIGERALEDIFGHIDGGLTGDHTLTRFGWGIERLDETKQYQFGDPFSIDAQRTIMNALRRAAEDPSFSGSVGQPGGSGATPLTRSGERRPRVNLQQDDFEIFQSASINQCSTVIMLDMSYSMLNRGRFEAGRKVALALDSLIRTKFPRDMLKVVAFSYFVLPLEPYMLLDDYWIDPRGTDFPEALREARRILGKRKGGTKQVIMITDGEPHANSTGWGWSGMSDSGWSMRQAMDDTLREVAACSKEGIIVNTFMLDQEPVMSTFIKTMTKINSGRVFFAAPDRLGEYLIVDYVKNRRRTA